MACNRECLIGLTEAYLSAMVARDPAKAPVTANVRFTQNTRPMALGQGVWESIKGVRGYKLFVTDPVPDRSRSTRWWTAPSVPVCSRCA